MSHSFYQYVVLVVLLASWTQVGASDDKASALKSMETMKQMGIKVKFLDDICYCEEQFCQCCMVIDIPPMNFTQKLCLTGAFIASDFELQANLALNDNTLGYFMLSGRNPPPLCINIPLPAPLPFPSPLGLCIRAKNVFPQDINLHFCIDILVRFIVADILTLPLNCMWVGLDGIMLAGQK